MKFQRGNKSIREALLSKDVKRVEFLTTGCILLNLAISQKGRKGGVPRGRISNFVGDGSSGKCEKNSYVLTEKGMIKIDDIVPDAKEGITKHSQTIYGHTHPVKTSVFYKERVKKTVYIKTKYGFEKEGTEEHPVMTWDVNESFFKLKKLSKIKKGDYIVIKKGMNFFPKNEYQFKKEEKIVRKTSNAKDFTCPDKMTNELATILGYMVADGNIFPGFVCISNSRKYIKEDFNNALLKLGIEDVQVKRDRITVSRVKFRDFIFNLFGKPKSFTARFKEVPKCILQSLKEHQAKFLKALIDCDGYFGKNSNLEYYTASFELAKQIQMMLLNFGIFASLNQKWNDTYKHSYYCVRICAEDIQIYSKEIGSLKYDFSVINSSKGMVSAVPNLLSKIWKDIELIRQKHNWCKNGKIKGEEKRFPNYRNTYRKGNCSHKEIEKLICLFNDYGDMSFYKDLLNYHFAEVVKKEIRQKETDVYDFTVPDKHLFWSGGMISHNTLLALEICAYAFHYVKNVDSDLFPKVKNINIVYDNVEGTMDLPLETMYGEDFVNGVEWIQSETCERFGKNFMTRVKNHKKGDSLLYVVDSIDALIPKAHQDTVDKYLKSNDDEMKEGFGAEKAKYFSKTFFKKVCSLMKNKDVTLICISQVREKINVMFGEKYYRTGGKAMDFYTHLVLWLAEKKKLEKNGLIYGVLTKANVKRSKVSKPFRIVEFPIILNHGIDNVGSMVDFLYGDKEITWKKKKYGRDGFIKFIENNPNEYNLLADAVEDVWLNREKESTPLRKKRFV